MSNVTREHLAGLELVQVKLASCIIPDGIGHLQRLIDQAKAAPSGEAVADERAAFEAWRLANFCGGEERLKKCSNAPDVYYYTPEQEAWRVWQARAALAPTAEVERLRAENEKYVTLGKLAATSGFAARLEEVSDERDTLRQQLATETARVIYLEALLHGIQKVCTKREMPSEKAIADIVECIDAALATKPEVN